MERLAHTHPDDRTELLSAYSDNAVDVLERRRAEDAISSCVACAQEVRELQLFKRLLDDLPTVQPPRSFTIDPATAPRPRWLLFPTLRLASALAAVLLFVTLGVDTLMPGSNSAGTTIATSAPAPNARSAQQAPQAELYADASAAASTAAESAVAADLAQPSAAASAAAAGAMPEQSSDAVAAEVPPEAQDSAGATGAAAASISALKAPEVAGEDTESAAANQATPAAPRSSFDTVVILELVLAAAALAFGAGAYVAWRRGV